MEIERRITFSDANVEYREGENGEKRPVITGYAAVFNTESRVLNGFVERIHPNAFDEVLSTGPDVIGVFNHDRNLLLGRTSNGTMKLTADGYGLRYELHPNERTSVGKDVVEWVKDRTVVGSSFAFAIKKDGTGDRWSRNDRGMQQREVRSVEILEDVGPVVRPAYPSASVVVSRRALEMALGENFRPSQTMANAAKRGLKLAHRNEGVDQVLVGIAERIADRAVISVEECEYVSNVYKRCVESKAKGWNGSAAWVEWQLAGGDAGMRWVQRRVEADEAPQADERQVTQFAVPEVPVEKRDEGEMEPADTTLSPRDKATYEAYEAIAGQLGPWSQNEAHYLEKSPFGAIRCANCAFYEAGKCEIVAGEIAQDAVCKLWVIPEDKMSEPEKNSEPAPETKESAQEEPQRDDVADAAIAKAAALKAILLSTRLHAASSAT